MNKIKFLFPDSNSSFKKDFNDYKEIKKLNDVEDFNICHGISIFPKKYFYLCELNILSKIHNIYTFMINNLNIPINDIEFFINIFHSSNTR